MVSTVLATLSSGINILDLPNSHMTNLKAELIQSEKYLPTLSIESILANMATSTSSTGDSSKSTPIIMKASEAQEFNQNILPPKSGQCAMCGAMKATHPTDCQQYGIICKACDNIGHALPILPKSYSYQQSYLSTQVTFQQVYSFKAKQRY